MELTRDELLQRLKIPPRELDEWLANGLIAPMAGAGSLFPESAVDEGELIRKFAALGYSLTEIQKIKKSVGLPVRDEKGAYVSRSDFLTIGELAEKSGTNVRTIKFWEEKGLVSPHRRTEGGFRLYRPADVVLIAFIKDLQTFNYTLNEIGSIMRLAGPDLGVTDADLAGMPPAEVEKAEGSLQFLIERMREVREASTRVEGIFTRRLRAVTRFLKGRKRS